MYEYQIPQEIDEKIPDYFYIALAGELCSVMGYHIFEKIDPYMCDEEGNELPRLTEEDCSYYDLDSSTYGWYEAFLATCEKLDLQWLIDYYTPLPWYESDIFDGIIENRVIHNFIEAKVKNGNSYYQYLTKKHKEKINEH